MSEQGHESGEREEGLPRDNVKSGSRGPTGHRPHSCKEAKRPLRKAGVGARNPTGPVWHRVQWDGHQSKGEEVNCDRGDMLIRGLWNLQTECIVDS